MENVGQNFMLLSRSYNLHLVFTFLSDGIQAARDYNIVILTLFIILTVSYDQHHNLRYTFSIYS